MAVESRIAIDLAREADFSIASLRVRPSLREVVSGQQTEVLEPRVMQVLVALARRRGEVASRDDLIEECWGGRVVGEDAITRCIARIRRLSEAHGGFAVETIARVGYRLLERPVAAAPTPVEPAQRRRRGGIAVAAAIALMAVVVIAGMQWRSAVRQQQAQARALAAVAELVQKDQYGRAFNLARPLLLADPALKDNPAFAASWKQIVLPARVLVAEAGAAVSFKPYGDPDGGWVEAGAGMIDAPRGPLLVKVTRSGFRTGLFVIANPGPSVENDPPNINMARGNLHAVALPLAREDALPGNMVLVPGTNVPVVLGGWSTDSRGNFALDVPAFGMARTEVSNEEFKQFIDAGGYDNPAYWSGVSAEDRKRFVDTTHRPGPAGWQLSTYPSGQADLPVGGISWYEAVAYARFRGQELPTIHHWLRAAFAPYDTRFNVAPAVALKSRFFSDGPAPARSETGFGPWGTYHMLGNMREWVWNFAGEKGLLLGGAWSDYAMENQGAYTADPMSRLPEYGMRLMQPLAASDIAPAWREPIHLFYEKSTPHREPVSDEAFEVMRSQFSTASAKPVEATVRVVRESRLWVAEEVVIKGQETVLFLLKPRAHVKALQPIIYAPAQDCCVVKRANIDILEQLRVAEFVVNSGRALVLPVWWNSYERMLPQPVDPAAERDSEREHALQYQRDMGVTLDYLESRSDIDAGKVGYLGFSRGATYNAIVLALEPRVKSAVLLSGGVTVRTETHPMGDMVNYAPRIRIPVLMINGRFDHITPHERSQKRLFALLGTPAEQKSHLVFDAGHYAFPPNTLAREGSNWFDRYLGAVAR